LNTRHIYYEKLWNILADLTTAIAKKSRRLQPKIIAELRTTRSLINILKTDSSEADLEDDVIPRIEAQLLHLKSNLVSKAANLGEEFLSLWMNKLQQFYSEKLESEQIKIVRFIPHIERNHYWMRIKITPKTPIKLVKDVSSRLHVSIKHLDDEHILIYGGKKAVHNFVKETAKRVQRIIE